jgi:hypothetical protein
MKTMKFAFLTGPRATVGTAALALLLAVPSSAQSSAATGEAPKTAPDTAKPATQPLVPDTKFGAYVETYYQWNANQPDNGITNFRGFDNRADTFALSAAAFSAEAKLGDTSLNTVFQWGEIADTYYGAEPNKPGASGAGATNSATYRNIQQAYFTQQIHMNRGAGRDLAVSGGLFLSPCGPESVAAKDNWFWSRSDLFFGLPFYHVGVRASLPLSDTWTVSLWGINGWNNVIDNNRSKAVMLQFTGTPVEGMSCSLMYHGGPERPDGAPEGQAWRHLFDANATWQLNEKWALQGQLNGGGEQNHFGASSWAAAALSVRYKLSDELYVALRGDAFSERVASNATGAAAPIFWPASWVSSGTACIDYRPGASEHVSFRLEYRHDSAGSAMFFGGKVTGNGTTVPYVPNRNRQDTITLGMTAWF